MRLAPFNRIPVVLHRAVPHVDGAGQLARIVDRDHDRHPVVQTGEGLLDQAGRMCLGSRCEQSRSLTECARPDALTASIACREIGPLHCQSQIS